VAAGPFLDVFWTDLLCAVVCVVCLLLSLSLFWTDLLYARRSRCVFAVVACVISWAWLLLNKNL
jgi:hypothetical protein